METYPNGHLPLCLEQLTLCAFMSVARRNGLLSNCIISFLFNPCDRLVLSLRFHGIWLQFAMFPYLVDENVFGLLMLFFLYETTAKSKRVLCHIHCLSPQNTWVLRRLAFLVAVDI